MFLLRCKARHFDSVKVVEDKMAAAAEARAWVGEHNPIDGCSTEPTVNQYTGRWHISRSSSFGTREAWVIDQSPNGAFEL